MPPRTRGRSTKTLKENTDVLERNKSRIKRKVTKAPRKALTDKINSASDDDMSVEKQKILKIVIPKIPISGYESRNVARPCRERRLPSRYIESDFLKNSSNSKNDTVIDSTIKVSSINLTKKSKTTKLIKKQSSSNESPVPSPLKTPQKVTNVENSLVVNRPKRLCRLPSKFKDHSLSPTKSCVIQPCHASTPIVQNKTTRTNQNVTPSKKSTSDELNKKNDKTNNCVTMIKQTPQKRHIQSPIKKSISDTNNNANQKLLRVRTNNKASQEKKSTQVIVSNHFSNKIPNKNLSFKVLEDKPSSKKSDNFDVYEFTYDPNEEPPPKKKRKRVTKKKPVQTRTVVFKNSYDRNVNKVLAALKNVVAKKSPIPRVLTSDVDIEKNIKQVVNGNKTSTQNINYDNIQINTNKDKIDTRSQRNVQNNNKIDARPQTSVQNNDKIDVRPEINIQNVDSIINHVQNNEPRNETINNITVPSKNYNSVRVEDIAADFEIDIDHNDINYSPVNSPHRAITPTHQMSSVTEDNSQRSVHDKDSLNHQGNLSFFDNIPIASSSMNMSVRHPQASPWRVEFGNLPVKWHSNTYVKPNMTPAVESSFISCEDNKKKHVYTNMLPQPDEVLPEIIQNNEPNLKQTSIISFIREIAEKNAAKKKRGRSVTPTKANSIFEDITNVSDNIHTAAVHKTPNKGSKTMKEKLVTSNKESVENVTNSTSDLIDDKENHDENVEQTNNKSAQKDKNATFFGFDDSEDQENVSPIKIDNPRVLALRPRARAVLQEINAQPGPTRAVLPIAAKSRIVASSDALKRVYEEIKSATDAPVISDKHAEEKNEGITNINNSSSDSELSGDDSQSVHLFEDLEIIHHLKPLRKSYGKSKKVTFQQRSTSDSDVQNSDAEQAVSSDKDDLADLTFTMPKAQLKKKPKITRKKPTKKQNKAKKEEEAAEAWAAGFNSMCEDIEEFPLVVE